MLFVVVTGEDIVLCYRVCSELRQLLLVQAVRRHGGRIVTNVRDRRIDAIHIRNIVNDATTIDKEVAHVDRGLEVVVRFTTTIGGNRVTMGRVSDSMRV